MGNQWEEAKWMVDLLGEETALMLSIFALAGAL
jgi:hypothetical protein